MRLARRAKELESLPYGGRALCAPCRRHERKALRLFSAGLSDKEPIRVVASLYVQSFTDVMKMHPPQTPQDEAEFAELCSTILNRHRNVGRLTVLCSLFTCYPSTPLSRLFSAFLRSHRRAQRED